MARRVTIVTVCLAALLLPLPGSTSSSPTLLFPVIDNGGGGFVGLCLVNTADAANDVTVVWTNADGLVSRSVTLSIPPGAQHTSLVREILGSPSEPRDGWLSIQSSREGLLGYLTAGSDAILDGVDPAERGSTRLLFDQIRVNTGFVELDYADTRVMLVNPGSEGTDATVELVELDGKVIGRSVQQVPASASRSFTLTGAFGETLPESGLGGRRFTGYMRIASAKELAGWVSVETPLSRRLARGRPIEEIESTTLAVAGHFACGGAQVYRSELTLVNAGESEADLELTAHDDKGGRLGSVVRVTLQPGQGFRRDVLEMLGIVQPAVYPLPLTSGYLRIRPAGGGTFRLAGNLDISSTGNTAAMGYPIATAPSRDWTIPFVVSGPEYFTGYAAANPNELLTVQTDLTVELVSPEGLPAAPSKAFSLSPSSRTAGLVERPMPAGYVRIRANLPVFALGSLGTARGTALAYLPAYPR